MLRWSYFLNFLFEQENLLHACIQFAHILCSVYILVQVQQEDVLGVDSERRVSINALPFLRTEVKTFLILVRRIV